jgi:penicillin-binding protein 1C
MKKFLRRYWITRKKRRIFSIASGIFLVWFYFCLPATLFEDPYSTVLESSENELLSASIAADGQWRFPLIATVPDKFKRCAVTFEDKRFYSHPGIDPFSIAKAIQQNIAAGEIVRGGSTITMQVIRLSRKASERTFLEKFYEMILAVRLELRHSKEEILQLYTSHAPFGGNVVGMEAACWRYFGRSEKELSWGEAAFLAVLPNAPSLIHPGKNRDALIQKRNRLLDALKDSGEIDELTCSLAKQEKIPAQPYMLPRLAHHLLTRAVMEGKRGTKIKSTVSYQLQARVEEIMANHYERLSGNEIHNGAAIIADVKTGNVIAYVGNNARIYSEGSEVDIVSAPRSTGSILKPLLYAASLDEGKILPHTLLPDVPAYINGFTPKNFSHEYDGAVNADQALIRSLNIPAVFLLKEYRYEKFHSLLRNAGMTTLTRAADHYGLSLILGGAEGTLWDIAGMYASMARTLNNYFEHPGANRYARSDFHPLRYLSQLQEDKGTVARDATSLLSAAAIYQTFDVLQELHRPGEESGCRNFESSRPIAWKTGTSFGFRDAWSIGVTPKYVVAVWIGNADGEGRPGLTGVEAAAPVMFDLFSILEGSTWFKMPKMEMMQGTVCRMSGQRNSEHCPIVDTLFLCARGLETASCAYHKTIHLSKDEKFQLNSRCASLSEIEDRSWFILPPVQEYYYRTKNLSYKTPPPFRNDCWPSTRIRTMDLVYPKPGSRLFIPRDATGEKGSAIFELAHRNNGSVVYWYLDGNYLGSTRKSHHFAINPPSGKHKLTLIDGDGDSIEEVFEVLSEL